MPSSLSGVCHNLLFMLIFLFCTVHACLAYYMHCVPKKWPHCRFLNNIKWSLPNQT